MTVGTTVAPAIDAARLTKHYGATTALDALDLRVGRGEIVGLVGPNGAGKSTLLKSLLGLVHLESGTARVLGRDAVRESLAIRRDVGYLPGDIGFYPSWRGERWLDFCLAWHPQASRERAHALAADFAVPLDRRVKTLSSGMRQKLGIVQALACGASLLLLDEPTKGLDPTSRAVFLDVLLREREAGRTVLLSSHVLDDIERTCDRIEFVDRGRAVARSAIDRVRAEFRRRVRVRAPDELIARVARLPFVANLERDGAEAVLEIEAGDGTLARAIGTLVELGVESLELNRPSLEDIYRRLYLDREKAPPC